MVKISSILFAFAPACWATNPEITFESGLDFGLNLLQLRATAARNEEMDAIHMASNYSSRVRDPSDNERAMCPHEIEAAQAARGNYRYGCASGLRAQSSVQCAIWGEPHVTALFPNGQIRGWDVLYKTGHFRLAAAADRSWEIQLFNCGVFASSIAARFGKTLVEAYIDAGKTLRYKVNGNFVNSLPQQFGELRMDSTHRTIHTDGFARVPAHYPGTCIDDPGGQVTIDIAQDLGPRNINFRIEADSSAVTTQASDSYSICNIRGATNGRAGWKWANWPVQMIPSEKSLFTIGAGMCEGCNSIYRNWVAGHAFHHGNSKAAGEAHCRAQQSRQAGDVLASAICADNNIAVAQAEEACNHLANNAQFFQDCQIDYCASGGQVIVAAEAENEEALENPQPVCISGAGCDPAADCCNALKDQATLSLSNVVTNEICSGGELRYGSAVTSNGQILDLVVKPVGDYECRGKMKPDNFGSKNDQIGILSVTAGTTQSFEFTFVQQGTNNPVAPQSMMMSFLDLDQGKNNKQRESVEICGAADTITTDDTEIELSVNGNCVKATSTTAGTGADNPDVLEEMSQQQRARSVVYKVTGSSFVVNMGVTPRGHNPRRFNFAGNPTVACVLK
jgi:ribonuclease HI